tara:strand:- start:152 stop:472 length:321 start_codon:yes stop_codon:yes gene_type:complete
MDKILSSDLNFEHILHSNVCNDSNNNKSKNTKKNKERIKEKTKNTNVSIINKEVPYLYELISRINIINEEVYDYIIFECGNKNTSKEFKRDVRSYLDKAMINYFKN